MFAGEMGYPQSAFFVDKPKVDGGLGSTAILRERCVSGIDLAWLVPLWVKQVVLT